MTIQLTFLDVETTGLPTIDEKGNEDFSGVRIVEVYAEKVNVWSGGMGNPDPVFERKFLLSDDDFAAASPEALKINGYDKEAWTKAGAVAADDNTAWTELLAFLKNALLTGQNIGFDWGCLRSEFFRRGLLKPGDKLPTQRRMVDIQGLSHIISDELHVNDGKGNASFGLTQVYRAIGGQEETHRAKPDVVAAKAIYSNVRNRLAELESERAQHAQEIQKLKDAATVLVLKDTVPVAPSVDGAARWSDLTLGEVTHLLSRIFPGRHVTPLPQQNLVQANILIRSKAWDVTVTPSSNRAVATDGETTRLIATPAALIDMVLSEHDEPGA